MFCRRCCKFLARFFGSPRWSQATLRMQGVENVTPQVKGLQDCVCCYPRCNDPEIFCIGTREFATSTYVVFQLPGKVYQAVVLSPLGCRLAVEDLAVFGRGGGVATGKVADRPPLTFACQLSECGESLLIPSLRVFRAQSRM